MDTHKKFRLKTRIICITLALALLLPMQVLAAYTSDLVNALIESEEDELEKDEEDDEEDEEEAEHQQAVFATTPVTTEDSASDDTQAETPEATAVAQPEAEAVQETPEPEEQEPEQADEPEEAYEEEPSWTVEITESENPEEDAAEDVEEDTVVEVFPDGLAVYGSDENLQFTQEEVQGILATLPGDTSPARAGAVLSAYSLVGKVSYFWGGKSTVIGWDERWGNSAYVTSAGSSKSGTLQTYGLDCSGYVNWVLCNTAGFDVADAVGHGTTGQWNLSKAVDWDEAQPGDLAFFYDPATAGSMNHVGVVVGWDEDGNAYVAHCSSGSNTVIVSEAKSYGFNYVRSPYIYENETFNDAAYSYRGLGDTMLWNSTTEVDTADARLGDVVFFDSAELYKTVETALVVGVTDTELICAFATDDGTVIKSFDLPETTDEVDEDGEEEPTFPLVRRTSNLNMSGGKGVKVSVKVLEGNG